MEDYKLIESVIVNFVKHIGVSIILSREVFKGSIYVYYFNWIGSDKRFYSLLAPCSNDEIFTMDGFWLETQADKRACLQHNLKEFATKEEWHIGMWDRQLAANYSTMLESAIKFLGDTKEISAGQYSLKRVQLWTKPSVGMTIWYNKGETLESITIWKGCITQVYSDDRDLKRFFSLLGITRFIQLNSYIKMQDLLEDKSNDQRSFE